MTRCVARQTLLAPDRQGIFYLIYKKRPKRTKCTGVSKSIGDRSETERSGYRYFTPGQRCDDGWPLLAPPQAREEIAGERDLEHLDAEAEVEARDAEPRLRELRPLLHGEGGVALLHLRLVDGQVGHEHLLEDSHGVRRGHLALADHGVAEQEAPDQRVDEVGDALAVLVANVAVRQRRPALLLRADLEAERRGEALVGLAPARPIEDGRQVFREARLGHRALERRGLVGREAALAHGVREPRPALLEVQDLGRLTALREEPAVLHAERPEELGPASHEKHSSHALPPSANTHVSRRAPPQRCRMN